MMTRPDHITGTAIQAWAESVPGLRTPEEMSTVTPTASTPETKEARVELGTLSAGDANTEEATNPDMFTARRTMRGTTDERVIPILQDDHDPQPRGRRAQEEATPQLSFPRHPGEGRAEDRHAPTARQRPGDQERNHTTDNSDSTPAPAEQPENAPHPDYPLSG